jgi:hypothetical protein
MQMVKERFMKELQKKIKSELSKVQGHEQGEKSEESKIIEAMTHNQNQKI